MDLDTNVASAPLLVVEVVSPSSRLVDLHLKRAVYAEMGIPSYWVVDPTQDWVVVSGLRGTGYEQVARAEGTAPLRVAEPFPVSFRPTDLRALPLTPPRRTLAVVHPSIERVTAALREKGAGGAADGVRILDDAARTAADAAAQLGVPTAAIANSLVFVADGEPVLVMASGGRRVDLARVAAALGAQRVTRADADVVRTATGFAIGGVAPVGHATDLRTLVDTSLAEFNQVWAAAGHPHSVFPTTYDELVAVTGGTPADVGERATG